LVAAEGVEDKPQMSEKLMFKAVKDGNVEAVKALAAADPALVHARDKEMNTPIHWAAWKGHPAVIDALLDAGADIHCHSQNEHWGTTPLHAAAHGNQKAAAEALLKRGADVNLAKPSGGTPLAETRVHNATATAKVLRQAGGIE